MGAGALAPPPALPDRPRILVISLRRIGDLLLTTPLISSLRRAWRRWPAYLIGLPIFLIVLYGFFENFAYLLPASY